MKHLLGLLLLCFSAFAGADILVITDNTTVQNATPDTQESGTSDTYIDAANATTNYGSATALLWRDDSGSLVSRMLLKADDFSTISGATINSATLYLKNTTGGGGDAFDVYAYAPLQAWVEGEATWNIYSTGNSWGTAGGSGGADRSSLLDTSVLGTWTNNVYVAIDVTNVVAGIAAGTYSNGVMLEMENIGSFAARFVDSSGGADGDRPEWVIDYTAASGASIPVLLQQLHRGYGPQQSQQLGGLMQ